LLLVVCDSLLVKQLTTNNQQLTTNNQQLTTPMSLSGIAKFLIGFLIGIFLLAGSGVAAAFYFWTKLSATPPKPIFAEEQPKKLPVLKKVSSPTASNSPVAKKPIPLPSPSESPTKELPSGAYKARVIWSEGLSLRDAPGPEANRVGGVAFNQEVIVLKASDDQKWQQIRLADGEQEGWIKAGNIEKINE
jgi:tetrahydromethanopterin S-methyltransferase subunit F